jgi:hypothetical protein
MRSEKKVFFHFCAIISLSYKKKKKDQHFNRKKTREKHLSEEK